jgi:6-phosphogluconate dehydrogenase
MQLGMIGLGRMGANMARRLMRGGHQCVVYDRSPDSVKALAAEGAKGSDSLAALVAGLAKPRAVWIMVPAGAPTESTVKELAGLLEPGHRDRRRQLVLQGRHPARRVAASRSPTSTPAPAAARSGSSAATPMVGGDQRRCAPRSDLQDPGAGARHRRAHAGRDKRPAAPRRGYQNAARSVAATSSRWSTTASYGIMQARRGFDIARAGNPTVAEDHRFDSRSPRSRGRRAAALSSC